MKLNRITVFLPCHTLHDFPTWLDESEADALLSAWTAAWHPWLIARVAAAPVWASVDLPPAPDVALGIVPAPWDDRFAAQADACSASASCWVRGVMGQAAIVSAAAAALAAGQPVAAPLPGNDLAAAFQGLGLATLLAELLSLRMRSATGLAETGFGEAVVLAAQAAVAGDQQAARDGLKECFGFLEATRSQYYPVDVWLLDLVLLADSTLGPALDRELAAPVPAAVVATGEVIERLAARNPAALARIRERCAAGTLAPVGGRYAAEPFDECTPEEIVASFEQGAAAWRENVGTVPVTYAQQSGGSSALLPQVLTDLGFSGVIWTLFDGTPLPDPGGSRIRWEGAGGGCINGVARPPLDARRGQTILSLPEKIGDCMDHDHTVVIQFAHYPGTASPWYDMLRLIGSWSNVLGRFVTPPEFFAGNPGAGTLVLFEPDTFPVGLPVAPPAAGLTTGHDAVVTHMAATCEEARRLSTAAEIIHVVVAQPAVVAPATATSTTVRGGRSGWKIGSLFGVRRGAADELVLEHSHLRVQVQRTTGGLLSVRRPADRGNRLSQRLALRTTRPAPSPGRPWEDVTERAVYSGMEADSIERTSAADGQSEAIVSRGRLISADRHPVGSFTQRMELVAGLPLVVIDIDVRLESMPHGPLLEHHAACRFAWNENEDLQVWRSLHTQSIATQRSRFTAPWFVELGEPNTTHGRLLILTGGLPWHLRSSPHMLDSILPTVAGVASGTSGACRLAVGIGIARPWDLAIGLLAGVPAQALETASLQTAVPANVRLTAGPVRFSGERLAAARFGLLESGGQSGAVRLELAAAVSLVRLCDAAGNMPVADASAAGVQIDGKAITLFLKRYQWLHLEVEFQP